jgi:hypothetical protein
MLANLNLDGGAVLSEGICRGVGPTPGPPQAYDFIKASKCNEREHKTGRHASVISKQHK